MTGASRTSASVTIVGEAPGRHTAAVRPGTWASGPHQIAHSNTSPRHDVHCASVPDGSAACGNAGDSFAPVAGTCAAQASTCGHGGEMASSENTRRARPAESRTPLTRRPGSTQTPVCRPPASRAPLSFARSTVSADPSDTWAFGHSARFARATAAVTGSTSTASTDKPEAAKALASEPIPHPRSTT
ncbi:MAG: hypothetical protein BWY91_00459 [bacterium ADurb.BinA028]|nr:MAG: hypothetical protein BWY91_00459 [bacterium ADurb.BinA028]